jgi:Flp pilus assembly protein TadD
MKTLCSSAVLAATVISCALLCVSSQSALAQQRPPAVADGTPEIDQAIADKQLITALSALDKRIASNPTDVQAKFKRATVLAQLKRDDDAIAAFTALTQQYPEVPEPYNNLAALYAKRGDLSQARATLETAVAANPAFALGYQNLGTLYLQMSSRAYQRAAALDHGDALALQRTAAIEQVLKPGKEIATNPVAASAPVASSQPGGMLPSGMQPGNPQGGLLSPSSLNHRY